MGTSQTQAASSSPDSPDSRWYPLFAAWFITVTGTLGSLFFSEVMRLPPCALCWYQRVALYPLLAIFTVAILYRDSRVGRYAWPLALFGTATGIYHLLLYYHLIPESIAPCTKDVPCTTRQIEWFGFISIPLLSLMAFFVVDACLLCFQRGMRTKNEN